MKSFIALLLTALLTAPAVLALPVDLIIRSTTPASPDVQEAPVQGVLTVRINDSSTEAASFVRKVEIPGKVTLDLPTETTWRATLEAPGFWSEPKSFAPQPERPIRINAWPTAEVRGMVSVKRGENVPEEIGVRFEPAPDSEWVGKLPRTEVKCPIEENRWTCKVPAIVADLRLRSPGFISHFFWNYTFQPSGVHQLGNLQLRRGASVVGKVEMWEGPLSEEIELTLSHAMHGGASSHAEEQRLQQIQRETVPDERGFFHFEDLSPGSYILTATYPKGAPTRIFPVNVLERAETELTSPVVLSPPSVLEARLNPAFNMEGKPWSVELLQISPFSSAVEHRLTGQATEEGIFKEEGLAPGSYLIRIGDSSGNVIASEQYELNYGSPPLEIDLPFVMVEGTIHFGDEPILGDLLFGGRFHPKQINLPSDHEGNFFGYLPHDGAWLVYVSSKESQIIRHIKVEVEAEEGLATLEVRLPETRLSGRVVDTEGAPQAGALVRAYDPELAQWLAARSDREGNFIFHGLPEGLNILVAETMEGASSDLKLDLVETLDPSPEFVVHPYRRLHGKVVGPSGPIPNAVIEAIEYEPSGTAPRFNALPLHAKTELDGTFTLRTTATSDRLRLVVQPPGFALIVSELMTHPIEPLEFKVDQTVGTVIFELEEPFDWSDPWSPRPSLWIDGVPYSFTTLANWRHVNNIRENGKELTVPALPPGQVKACYIAPEPKNFNTMPEATFKGCREGFLSPGGVLRLNFEPDP